MSLDAGERIYAADVDYPMMVVGTAGRGLIIYTLEGQPKEYRLGMESINQTLSPSQVRGLLVGICSACTAVRFLSSGRLS